MVSKYSRSRSAQSHHFSRSIVILSGIFLGLIAIMSRLFYWQILQGNWLRTAAANQYQQTLTQQGQRGQIFTSDGHLLVGNKTVYHLVGYPQLFQKSATEISQKITPLLLPELESYQEASQEAKKETLATNFKLRILEKLERKDAQWVSLLPGLSAELKLKLESLNIDGLGFEPSSIRYYPEASMAAHVTGFVGKNNQGQPIGYFGVEGALNKELTGKTTTTIRNTDALGFGFFGQKNQDLKSTQGRDVILTIRRDLQFMAEKELERGLRRYDARAGEIIILEPSTGKILALAAEPKFDQATFNKSEPWLYKNPALVNLFEPGSIMKTLTVAAGIDAGVIEPETKCPDCAGPRTIGKYTIKTWNNQYHPQISVREALAKSDNIAMINIAEKLGADKFRQYLENFSFGQELEIDLDGDEPTPFPQKWGPVELATRSFGQGISATSLQMMRAISSIANHGMMMQPQIVEKVLDAQGNEMIIKPKQIRQVISPKTASQVAEMMVYAAKHGEAQWTYLQTHSVAGKTGTSQIPAQTGGYKTDATIASFIGFAPPEKPRFMMLVKLIEPHTSPWAAETAAPLWYKIAEKLFLSLNIPPDH